MAKKAIQPDRFAALIKRVLTEQCGSKHPKAKIDVYRYNPASVRVRIIDPDFKGKDFVERDEEIWDILESELPEDVRADISVLLLITPQERKKSMMNIEFENPSPSGF
jgi:stress-induced morphogen